MTNKSTEMTVLSPEAMNPYSRSQLKSLSVPTHLLASARIGSVDLMRGIALLLMILSHCTKALLTWEQYPQWGLAPLHALTKFSSSLFIMTFGISLAVAYLPHVGTRYWPQKRSQLWWRSLEIMFWYKILTVVQMFQNYSQREILDALMFKTFPDFVEVLGFYSIALIWLPLFLPLWKKSNLVLKFSYLGLMIYAQIYFSHHFIWHNLSLKAIIVENSGYFTFGQFARGPLILLGLILGEEIYTYRNSKEITFVISLFLISMGALALGVHHGLHRQAYMTQIIALAKNAGKHPPSLSFFLFSVGGALMISGLCLAGGRILSRIFYPITLLGQYSLQVFIFHIVVIFVFYRYLLDYRHTVDHHYALQLSLLLAGLSVVWAGILKWRRSLV